jgi:hypothetical protein
LTEREGEGSGDEEEDSVDIVWGSEVFSESKDDPSDEAEERFELRERLEEDEETLYLRSVISKRDNKSMRRAKTVK